MVGRGAVAATLGEEAAGARDEVFAGQCDRAVGRAYGLAGYLLGDAAEAEDATQEAMGRAWRARGSLREQAAFGPWLDRIVVNVCRDTMRRHRIVRVVEVDLAEGVESGDPFREFLARDELGAALSRLTPDQRILVVLRFWRDLPLEQIADRLGWPLGTVKSRLHHALAALRDVLEREREAEVRR